MKHSSSLVASSIFFLAGSLLYVAPALARSILYAARMSSPSWQIPDPTVERLVPESLTNFGFIAYTICAILVSWSLVEPWLVKWLSSPTNVVQQSREAEPPHH